MSEPERSDRLDRYLAAPRRALWTMALPMMVGMAVHTLYVIADTAFIGRIGTEALAAATFVAPLFFLMVALTMGMGTAVTALIAQAVGRRDVDDADRVAGTALTAGVAMGVALAVAGLASGQHLLALLGASGTNAELAWQYFQIIAIIVPLFFVSTVFRSILAGEGDARTPMLVLTLSTVLNIGFDALFILVLGLGLRGAAVATTLALLCSLSIFATLLLRRRRAFVRLRLDRLVPVRPVLSRLLALAMPIAAGMVVMAVGSMLVNRLLAGFGELAVAAYGAASKVDMIVALPIFGLAGAAVTIVGMFAGAERVDLVRSTALYTYRWALTLAAVIGASAFLSSEALLGIFTREPEALEIGRVYLGYMIFAYPMMAIGMTTGRLLQGLGHGLPALTITAVRVLLVGVPAAYLAVWVLGSSVGGVWGGLLFGGACSTLLSIFWVRRLVWQQDPTRVATGVATSEAA